MMRFEERTEFVRKFTERGASKAALEQFLATCAAENPNRRLRMIALSDRVSTPVERADFDDLVTLVIQAPTWEKDRLQGIRILLRAIADGHAVAPDQILERWTWKLARASRKVQDRRASAEFPEAKRLLGALANSRGHRHEENAAKLVNTAREQPLAVGAALLASSEGYTPRANQLLDAAREQLGTIREIAAALADNLPQPKLQPARRRRRKRKRRPDETKPAESQNGTQNAAEVSAHGPEGSEAAPAPKRRRRRRRKPAAANGEGSPSATAPEPGAGPTPD
jgi:hypothetical protein